MGDRKEIYADGLGQINLTGGVVRYDFVTIQPGEDGEKTFAKEQLRVIMPLQGFLTAYGSMQELIGKLIEAGILKKSEPAKPAKQTKKTAKAKAASAAKTVKAASAAKPRAKKK